VRSAGFTVHDRASLQDTTPPLGVASTLRRAKSKTPALHRRAESPVINSTGQRPVETGIYPQSALKGRNPHSFDSAPSRRDGRCITAGGAEGATRGGEAPCPLQPRRGGICITGCKRSAAYGCGVHLHRKTRRDGTVSPLRGLRERCLPLPRVTPSASPAVMHIPPFQGFGRGYLFIHRALPCANDLRAFSPSSA
jgi:hypothetical protein